MYLLRYQIRDDICERGTNKLSWKKAKIYVNDDLFVRMADYWPPGPKEDEYQEYEKLQFIKNCISGYKEEEVNDYSTALGKVLQWVNCAIDVRIEDVKQRRAQFATLEAERK